MVMQVDVYTKRNGWEAFYQQQQGQSGHIGGCSLGGWQRKPVGWEDECAFGGSTWSKATGAWVNGYNCVHLVVPLYRGRKFSTSWSRGGAWFAGILGTLACLPLAILFWSVVI